VSGIKTTNARVGSAPAEIAIEAYAIFRDLDVLVAQGTHVEMSGGVLRGDLRPPGCTSASRRLTRLLSSSVRSSNGPTAGHVLPVAAGPIISCATQYWPDVVAGACGPVAGRRRCGGLLA
jgi:hypothetical protein